MHTNPLRIRWSVVGGRWSAVLFCFFLAGTARAELMAGAARVSITPDPKEFSYPLGGYVAPARLGHNATGVHDT